MAKSEIGFLISLNQNLAEVTSVPQLPILQGLNVVGRNTISVLDKRLSRKHLTLIASEDGSASVVVEGTNPIVICSGNQRKKLCSRESAKIISGDVIELIPGHHLFKYVALAGDDNAALDARDYGPSSKEVKSSESEQTCRKRTHQASDSEEIARKLTNKMGKKKEGDCEETNGNFNVAEDKIPLTFRLLRVKGLQAWANSHCLSITDVIQGNVLIAIISNYMVDIDWLLSACPALAKIPHVLVIHGESDGSLDHMKRNKPANWILHKPPLPISYGTHHSKALLLVYPRGLRVVVHTANLIHVDWNNKTQGLWMQDFPWKHQNDPNRGGGFETDLIDYLSVLKWPEFTASLPSIGSFNINPSFFKKFDYSSAAVRLIASVPGYHTSPYLKKWGHMKLRTVLQECIFDKEFQKSPLIYQFSSLGSLDEKWMAELASSMSSGVSSDKKPLGLGEPQIIWPTVEDVRCSLEGYAAGNAIPSPQKNVEKEFLKKYWSKWKASHTGRCRAMPHIKTYARYAGQNLAWFLLSSANLSKAAWGALQKNNSQLMIRSYELGVLFLPSSMRKICCKFSCTDNANPEVNYGPAGTSQVQETKLVTSAWQGMGSEVIRLPVPYELPPKPYDPEDIPWSWDRKYHKKDVYGEVWPRQVKVVSFRKFLTGVS